MGFNKWTLGCCIQVVQEGTRLFEPVSGPVLESETTPPRKKGAWYQGVHQVDAVGSLSCWTTSKRPEDVVDVEHPEDQALANPKKAMWVAYWGMKNNILHVSHNRSLALKGSSQAVPSSGRDRRGTQSPPWAQAGCFLLRRQSMQTSRQQVEKAFLGDMGMLFNWGRFGGHPLGT